MEIKYREVKVVTPRIKQSIYSYLKMNGYSENYLKNLRKEFGFVKLNNKECFLDEIVKENDVIFININPNAKTSISYCVVPLDVVYEDEYILAINKPSNLPTMPSRSHYNNNLSGAISYYMKDKDPNFVVRIVNRLDKDTAGVVLVAKDSLTSNFLNNSSNTKKIYYALCKGDIKSNIVIDKNIDTLKNEFGYNINKRVISSHGKPAKTFVEVVNNFENYSLVRLTLEHGRTHQIRVHMSSIGHPLIGDELYGDKSELINHTALVCKEIEFVHPITLEVVKITVPYPNDFKSLIRN